MLNVPLLLASPEGCGRGSAHPAAARGRIIIGIDIRHKALCSRRRRHALEIARAPRHRRRYRPTGTTRPRVHRSTGTTRPRHRSTGTIRPRQRSRRRQRAPQGVVPRAANHHAIDSEHAVVSEPLEELDPRAANHHALDSEHAVVSEPLELLEPRSANHHALDSEHAVVSEPLELLESRLAHHASTANTPSSASPSSYRNLDRHQAHTSTVAASPRVAPSRTTTPSRLTGTSRLRDICSTGTKRLGISPSRPRKPFGDESPLLMVAASPRVAPSRRTAPSSTRVAHASSASVQEWEVAYPSTNPTFLRWQHLQGWQPSRTAAPLQG